MSVDPFALNHYEKRISFSRSVSPEVRAVLAGASRAVRLAQFPANPETTVVTEIGASVVGPLATLYVWWILREASLRGVKRLYFLARDGMILKKVADVLKARWRLDIDLRYLYCSRESLLLPSLDRVDDFALSWVTWGYLSSISIAEICCRLRITPVEFLNETGLRVDPDIPLGPESLRAVKEVLRSPGIGSFVAERNADLSRKLDGYLSGMGFRDGIPYAIVDTGWKATSQYALSSFLEKIGCRPPSGVTGMYFGLNRGFHRFRNDTSQAFLFDWQHEPVDYRLYYFLCFELLFSANDGRTIAYGDEDSSYRPLLAENPAERNSWIVNIHHNAAEVYADYIGKVFGINDYQEGFQEVARNISSEFISNPTPDESRTYGELIIAGEIGERDLQAIAPSMSYRDLLLMILKKKRVRGFWPQASMVRSRMRLARAMYCLFLDSGILDWYRRVILKY